MVLYDLFLFPYRVDNLHTYTISDRKKTKVMKFVGPRVPRVFLVIFFFLLSHRNNHRLLAERERRKVSQIRISRTAGAMYCLEE